MVVAVVDLVYEYCVVWHRVPFSGIGEMERILWACVSVLVCAMCMRLL